MVGGEGGGRRPRRPQCRRAGGLAGQCVCMGGSKGCGWRLSWRSNSSRGDGPRGAPASSGRRQWRVREAALSSARANVREGEVRGASGEPNGVHAGQVARPAGPRSVGGRLCKGRLVKFSTDLEINILKVTDLHGLVKLFSRTLTGFLRVQTSEFEMPTME
jgi:hypothetical protein